MPIVDDALIGRIFREESGRSVASLIRSFGDIDLAEDAVQDAYATAVARWPVDGVPDNPRAWIVTVARNRAIDRLRRRRALHEHTEELARRVEQELTAHGAIHVTKDIGLFEAWKDE